MRVKLQWHVTSQWHYDVERVERAAWWSHWNWEYFDEKNRMVGHQCFIVEISKHTHYVATIQVTRDGTPFGALQKAVTFDTLDAAQRHCELWLSDSKRQITMAQRYAKRRDAKGVKA